MGNFFGKIKLLFQKGLFHIFGANAINKVIAFATNIAIVWFLSKEDYGIFSYANSIYSIVMLLSGLGLISGMFQFCLEKGDIDTKNAIYKYSLIHGLQVNFILGLILIGVGLLIPLPIERAGFYLLLFAPLVLLQYLFEYMTTVLRITKDNQRYAFLEITNTVLYLIGGCGGAYVGGIAGTILGRYIAFIICLLIGFSYLIKKHSFTKTLKCKHTIDSSTKGSLWRYSVSTQVSAGLNQLTYLLDIFLIGVFISSATVVAYYRVGTMLPEGLLFIPASLIVFVLPYFVENNHDKRWFKPHAAKLLFASSIVYIGISILLVIFAEQIITLLWGSEYLEATGVFRILAVSFAFSSIRTTCTNLLCAIRAIKSNLVISVVSLILNVVLCVILIPRYGISGAAFAPTIVSIAAAIIAFIMLVVAVENIGKDAENN